MKFRLYIAALHAALLCLVLAVSPAGSGSMMLLGVGKPGNAAVTPVAVNAVGTVAVSGLTTSFAYNSLTIAAGSNIALIVTVMLDSTATPPTTITATWDSGGTNQAMTLLAASPSVGTAGGSAIVFGLRNPIVGNKTLTIATNLSDFVYVDAIAFNNVSQTSDATAFPVAGRGTNSGTATNPATVTIPSSVNDYCVSVTSVPSGNGRSTQSDTELYFSTAGGTNNAEAQYGVGVSSKTMTVTLTSASGTWLMAAVDVAAGP